MMFMLVLFMGWFFWIDLLLLLWLCICSLGTFFCHGLWSDSMFLMLSNLKAVAAILWMLCYATVLWFSCDVAFLDCCCCEVISICDVAAYYNLLELWCLISRLMLIMLLLWSCLCLCCCFLLCLLGSFSCESKEFKCYPSQGAWMLAIIEVLCYSVKHWGSILSGLKV